VTLAQFSSYCKTALPFLGMFYCALVTCIDGRKDRAVFFKQGVSFIFYAALAYFGIFGPDSFGTAQQIEPQGRHLRLTCVRHAWRGAGLAATS
jgi:hypothetical protein